MSLTPDHYTEKTQNKYSLDFFLRSSKKFCTYLLYFRIKFCIYSFGPETQDLRVNVQWPEDSVRVFQE